MAKQDEQKQKNGSATRLGRSVASVPARSSAARTKTVSNTQPLPQVEVNTANEPVKEQLPGVPATIRRRQLLIGGAGLAATTLALGGLLWATAPHASRQETHAPLAPQPSSQSGDQLVVYWNNATLEVLRDLQSPLPVAARALSIVHTSMFDAWAAYDTTAVGSRLGPGIRQPDSEQTLDNKCRATSYAAYRALLNLFPTEQPRFEHLMTALGYDPSATGVSTNSPIGVGNLTAQAVLDFRQNDGSNQAGNLQPGTYADYTHYEPLNTPQEIKRPNHWQPLSLPEGQSQVQIQQFACAQWANVIPFALTSALSLVPRPGPARYPDDLYTEQAQQILQYSANLNDPQKVSAEYWTASPDIQLLARWFAFARFISERDNHSLDQNIQLFFGLANVSLDTSIACWATKRTYDSSYPITAIHYLFNGKQIRAWGGPGKGQQWFAGQYWLPYRSPRTLAPAYPEYCSEQSAFSSACAAILRNFTGRDTLGATYTQPAHSLSVEPAAPTSPVTLSWSTLSQAANDAGMAGRYSGTHFPQSDLDGRLLGSRVAAQVWLKTQSYIHGHPGN